MVLHIRHGLVCALCILVVCASAVLSARWSSHRATGSIEAVDALPLVTVDAGHGGFDGGASAENGTEEKGINLQVALPLGDMLRLCGARVQMTRTGDEALCEDEGVPIRQKKVRDMQERLALFEQADWNISIHQNFFAGASSSGTQVFYSANHPSSEWLAEAIQSQMVSWLQPDNDRAIKSGNRDIYLLYKTTVPTVLVECGFLSNPTECERLESADYRQQLAWVIACGWMRCVTASEGGTT